MALTMRPTGLGHGVYKDSIDYGVFSGDWCIGRIYENRSGPEDQRWFWALHTGIGELRVLAIPILECRCSISLFLTGTAAAGAIALINATGNLGGFVGPFVVGWIKDSTNSFEAGLYFLAASALCGAIIAFLAPRASGKQSAIQPADPSVTPQAGH